MFELIAYSLYRHMTKIDMFGDAALLVIYYIYEQPTIGINYKLFFFKDYP